MDASGTMWPRDSLRDLVSTTCRLVLNTPRCLPDGKTLWPSDHYGVAAEIELFPVRAAAGEARRTRTTAGFPQALARLR